MSTAAFLRDCVSRPYVEGPEPETITAETIEVVSALIQRLAPGESVRVERHDPATSEGGRLFTLTLTSPTQEQA